MPGVLLVAVRARSSKPEYAKVLANRCGLCDLPKHLHERAPPHGDIRVKLDVPNRIEYPDVCYPNPGAARRLGMAARPVFGRRVA